MYGDLLSNRITPDEEVKVEFDITSENQIALILIQRGKTQIQINLSEEELLSLQKSLLVSVRWLSQQTQSTTVLWSGT